MADNNVNPFCNQGEVVPGARVPGGVLGTEVPYPHKLTRTGDRLSGFTGRAMIVMNDSGGTLTRCLNVRFKSGYYGQRIGAVAGAGEPSDGVVDHCIPSSGVPDGSCFLLVVAGPVRLISDGAATLSIHEVVKTAANGKVTEDAGTPSTNGKCAKVMEAATNVDGTEFWGNFVGP
jgi:hypothetical protein